MSPRYLTSTNARVECAQYERSESQRKIPMPLSTPANATDELFVRDPTGSVASGVAPSSAAEPSGRMRLQRIATALHRAEASWISNETPVQGSIVAFHDPNDVDASLVPYFMLPSLPQQSTDFIELAGMMDPRQPFFAAYMPSDMRHPAMAATIADVAQHYAGEIHKTWPTGPIAIGGWSAGPAIALATAELLRDLGHAVPLLVAIDGAPPAVDPGSPGLLEKTKLTYYRLTNAAAALAQLGCDVVRRARRRSAQAASFRDAARAAWQASAFRPIWQRVTGPIVRRLATRRTGSSLTQRHPADTATDTSALPAQHRKLVTALYDAIHAYVPAAEFPGRVVVFESTAEPARSSGGVAKRWAKIATNLTVVAIKGTHMSIVAEPDGRPLARFLGQKLREVSANQPAQAARSASLASGATGSQNYRGAAASPAG